ARLIVSPLRSPRMSSGRWASSTRLRSTTPRCAKRRIAGPACTLPRAPLRRTRPWRSRLETSRDAVLFGSSAAVARSPTPIGSALSSTSVSSCAARSIAWVPWGASVRSTLWNSCSTLCRLRTPRRSGQARGRTPMFVNKMPRYEILSEDAMETLDRGWRRIVSELGVEFLLEESLEEFRKAGQKVEGNNVKLDPDFILEQVAKAPREFDIQARNPERSVHIGGDHMVFASVYGPPFVREGDVRRDATMEDYRNFVKLSQSFPQLDSPGGTIVEPNDTPLDSRHLDMVYALQTLSDKPYMGSVISAENARDTIAMGEIAFGGADALDRAPVSISLINCNSPLRWDDRMLSAMLEYNKRGQAVIVTPFLLMGAMSPVSIPATLVQQIAEALSGIALTQ